MSQVIVLFHDRATLACGRPVSHLPRGRITNMQPTLAFAPTAEDLEEDFFGLPVATFAPPPPPPDEAPDGQDDEAKAA
jgi:hypothetical protein